MRVYPSTSAKESYARWQSATERLKALLGEIAPSVTERDQLEKLISEIANLPIPWMARGSDAYEWHRALATEELAKENAVTPSSVQALAEALARFEVELRSEVGLVEIDRVAQADPSGAMLFADAVLADKLEATGDPGKELADGVRQSARARWIARGEKNIFSLYDIQDDGVPLWARLAAEALRPEATAKQFKPHVVSVSGANYSKIQKIIGDASWSFGGFGVEVDGQCYREAPGVVRAISRAVALLPDGRKAAQLDLPLEHVALTPGRAISDTQAIVSPLAAKALLLMMTTTTPSTLVRSSVGQLTAELNPEKARIQARDHQDVADAVLELSRLKIVFADGTSTPLFVVRCPMNPADATPEQTVTWMVNPLFLDAASASSNRRGFFIVNLTQAMRFTLREAALFRQYITACSVINEGRHPVTGEFEEPRVEEFTSKTWLARTNVLSPSAIDYIAEHDPSRRKFLSRDWNLARTHLAELERRKLVVINEVGPKRFKVLPPEELLEAWRRHREGGRQAGQTRERTYRRRKK